jgi:hypothetical protein
MSAGGDSKPTYWVETNGPKAFKIVYDSDDKNLLLWLESSICKQT